MRVHGIRLPLPNEGLARPARPRGWRLWRLLDAVVVLALVLVVVAAASLNPNRPWMKRHVQAFLLSKSGLEVDYRWIYVHPLSGLEISDLTVRAAPEFREMTPDLLRISLFQVGWSVSSLLGRGPRLEWIALSDVDAAIVVDEQGRTSIDAIHSSSQSPSSSRTPPLSHRPGQLLASAPIAGRVDITRAHVELIWTRGSGVVERDRIRGLAAAVIAEPAGKSWRVRAGAGSILDPLDVQWTRQRYDGSPPRTARAGLSVAAVLAASTLDASLDLKRREPPVVSGPEVGQWHAEASARFDPAAGRTTVAFEQATVPAGAAALKASIELPDSGVGIVRHAQGEVDVSRLLEWMPAGFVPLTAEGGVLHFELESANLEPPTSLSAGGFIHVDADLRNARVHTPAGTIDVERSRTVFDAWPAIGTGIDVHGSQQVNAARAVSQGVRVDIHDVAIDLDGQRTDDGSLTGRLDLRFGRLQQRVNAVTAIAHDGDCQVRVGGLYPPGSDGRGMGAREIDANARGLLQVFDGRKRLIGAAPARGTLELRDVFPDTRLPLASRGAVRASLHVGGDRVSLEAAKDTDAIDYALHAVAPSLKGIRAFLSPALVETGNWNAMALDLRSNGRIEGIASQHPRLQQDTSVDIARPALRGLSARALSLTLHSEDRPSGHLADAQLRASALTIDGTPASDDRLALWASWDGNPTSVHLQASVAGRVEGQAELSAAFDRDARAVIYDATGRLSGLAPLAPLAARLRQLDGLDLSNLELAVTAHGELRGLLSRVGSDGAIVLEPNPWRTAAIEGAVDVRVANVRWTRHDLALNVPAAVWHGDMRSDGDARVLAAHADIASLRLGLGRHEIDFAGISDDTTATVSGDLLNPAVELTQRMAVRTVDQDFVAAYPAADATVALSLQREPEGLVRISDLRVHDSAGTTLALRGGIDLGARRSRKLSVAADIVQDLEPLSVLPARFSGRGRVKVAAIVESPDLAFFRTRLDVTATGVQVRIPSARVEAQSVNAEIPMQLDFDTDGHGAHVRRDGHNAYATLRFGDQHPFLRRRGFVSIRRITMPELEIAPFVGNLAVHQNVVSLGQFEMGVLGGWLAGEGALDWDGPNSSLMAHLRATRLQSTHGEAFDGNMAVVVSASDRSIEGRAEILHMGKRSLRNLLDVVDPLRVDPAMNRVRGALALGYPSRLHVAFGNGFARARIELGGLARFISVDELRGIPTGPLVDRLVKAVLDGRVEQ